MKDDMSYTVTPTLGFSGQAGASGAASDAAADAAALAAGAAGAADSELAVSDELHAAKPSIITPLAAIKPARFLIRYT